MTIENVKHIVIVLSGKGGVGKSSVTLQLALSLSQLGHNVGILDIDLTGPSIPRLVGLENAKVTQAPGGWKPVLVHPRVGPAPALEGSNGSSANGSTPPQSRGSLHCMSLGFLLRDRGDAVIWRGPKKTAMVRQFISDVLWPEHTDYLLIDTPPGTSDEHIALAEQLMTVSSPSQLAGAVVVTTPQAVATSDVRKELNFCVKTAIPVLGVVENMAGYMCPCCGEISNVFSKGGGQIMATDAGVRFLGGVPVDTDFGALVEGAKAASADSIRDKDGTTAPDPNEDLLVEKYRGCRLAPIFRNLAGTIVTEITVA